MVCCFSFVWEGKKGRKLTGSRIMTRGESREERVKAESTIDRDSPLKQRKDVDLSKPRVCAT
jgi:hypothetical protein